MPEFLQEFIQTPYFGLLVFDLAILWPVWRILRRAGLPPAWSLLVIVPFGLVPVIGILAHRRWPNLPVRVKPVRKARRSLS